jgi:putative glutamine amidotransferase
MKERKPRIGITQCSKISDYSESVRKAGGDPVVLDWNTMSPAAALASVDGILMTGGPDVDPAKYGEAPHTTAHVAPPERDAFELELAAQALERDTPLLAVCRGMQVLNVAAGGTLTQDIPTAVPGAAAHAVNDPKNAIAHPVRIAPGSRVAALLGRTSADVNSRHHQAVNTPAPGLLVTATAPDGIVEAIEKPDAQFCVGVEWHPENFVESGEFSGLFRGLVVAAGRALGKQGR